MSTGGPALPAGGGASGAGGVPRWEGGLKKIRVREELVYINDLPYLCTLKENGTPVDATDEVISGIQGYFDATKREFQHAEKIQLEFNDNHEMSHIQLHYPHPHLPTDINPMDTTAWHVHNSPTVHHALRQLGDALYNYSRGAPPHYERHGRPPSSAVPERRSDEERQRPRFPQRLPEQEYARRTERTERRDERTEYAERDERTERTERTERRDERAEYAGRDERTERRDRGAERTERTERIERRDGGDGGAERTEYAESDEEPPPSSLHEHEWPDRTAQDLRRPDTAERREVPSGRQPRVDLSPEREESSDVPPDDAIIKEKLWNQLLYQKLSELTHLSTDLPKYRENARFLIKNAQPFRQWLLSQLSNEALRRGMQASPLPLQAERLEQHFLEGDPPLLLSYINRKNKHRVIHQIFPSYVHKPRLYKQRIVKEFLLRQNRWQPHDNFIEAVAMQIGGGVTVENIKASVNAHLTEDSHQALHQHLSYRYLVSTIFDNIDRKVIAGLVNEELKSEILAFIDNPEAVADYKKLRLFLADYIKNNPNTTSHFVAFLYSMGANRPLFFIQGTGELFAYMRSERQNSRLSTQDCLFIHEDAQARVFSLDRRAASEGTAPTAFPEYESNPLIANISKVTSSRGNCAPDSILRALSEAHIRHGFNGPNPTQEFRNCVAVYVRALGKRLDKLSDDEREFVFGKPPSSGLRHDLTTWVPGETTKLWDRAKETKRFSQYANANLQAFLAKANEVDLLEFYATLVCKSEAYMSPSFFRAAMFALREKGLKDNNNRLANLRVGLIQNNQGDHELRYVYPSRVQPDSDLSNMVFVYYAGFDEPRLEHYDAVVPHPINGTQAVQGLYLKRQIMHLVSSAGNAEYKAQAKALLSDNSTKEKLCSWAQTDLDENTLIEFLKTTDNAHDFLTHAIEDYIESDFPQFPLPSPLGEEEHAASAAELGPRPAYADRIEDELYNLSLDQNEWSSYIDASSAIKSEIPEPVHSARAGLLDNNDKKWNDDHNFKYVTNILRRIFQKYQEMDLKNPKKIAFEELVTREAGSYKKAIKDFLGHIPPQPMKEQVALNNSMRCLLVRLVVEKGEVTDEERAQLCSIFHDCPLIIITQRPNKSDLYEHFGPAKRLKDAEIPLKKFFVLKKLEDGTVLVPNLLKLPAASARKPREEVGGGGPSQAERQPRQQPGQPPSDEFSYFSPSTWSWFNERPSADEAAGARAGGGAAPQGIPQVYNLTIVEGFLASSACTWKKHVKGATALDAIQGQIGRDGQEAIKTIVINSLINDDKWEDEDFDYVFKIIKNNPNLLLKVAAANSSINSDDSESVFNRRPVCIALANFISDLDSLDVAKLYSIATNRPLVIMHVTQQGKEKPKINFENFESSGALFEARTANYLFIKVDPKNKVYGLDRQAVGIQQLPPFKAQKSSLAAEVGVGSQEEVFQVLPEEGLGAGLIRDLLEWGDENAPITDEGPLPEDEPDIPPAGAAAASRERKLKPPPNLPTHYAKEPVEQFLHTTLGNLKANWTSPHAKAKAEAEAALDEKALAWLAIERQTGQKQKDIEVAVSNSLKKDAAKWASDNNFNYVLTALAAIRSSNKQKPTLLADAAIDDPPISLDDLAGFYGYNPDAQRPQPHFEADEKLAMCALLVRLLEHAEPMQIARLYSVAMNRPLIIAGAAGEEYEHVVPTEVLGKQIPLNECFFMREVPGLVSSLNRKAVGIAKPSTKQLRRDPQQLRPAGEPPPKSTKWWPWSSRASRDEPVAAEGPADAKARAAALPIAEFINFDVPQDGDQLLTSLERAQVQRKRVQAAFLRQEVGEYLLILRQRQLKDTAAPGETEFIDAEAENMRSVLTQLPQKQRSELLKKVENNYKTTVPTEENAFKEHLKNARPNDIIAMYAELVQLPNFPLTETFLSACSLRWRMHGIQLQIGVVKIGSDGNQQFTLYPSNEEVKKGKLLLIYQNNNEYYPISPPPPLPKEQFDRYRTARDALCEQFQQRRSRTGEERPPVARREAAAAADAAAAAAPSSEPPGFVGIPTLKLKQEHLLEDFKAIANADDPDWGLIAGERYSARKHFDWWAFPIKKTSSRPEYEVNDAIIAKLKRDKEYMARYRAIVGYLMRSYGWDIENNVAIDNGRAWSGYEVRLNKMRRSLHEFSRVKLLDADPNDDFEEEFLNRINDWATKHADNAGTFDPYY